MDDKPIVDFGRAAKDYARHRPGFPPSFFRRLLERGVGGTGQRILDLGIGTGSLARGFARQGARAIGLDVSIPLMREARVLDPSVPCVAARAERVPLLSATFDEELSALLRNRFPADPFVVPHRIFVMIGVAPR